MARDDDPYARSRDYDLQNVRTHLRFDVEQKKVIGEVTESLAILRDGASELRFDSVGLAIESVTLNRAAAKFETQAGCAAGVAAAESAQGRTIRSHHSLFRPANEGPLFYFAG